MIHTWEWSLIGTLMLAIALALYLRPRHGRHELERGNELDWLPATLAPLPVPDELRAPRVIADVRPPVRELRGAPRASCGKWRSMVDSLIEASWQDHLTLQRVYDMQAFTTVLTALERRQCSYA